MTRSVPKRVVASLLLAGAFPASALAADRTAGGGDDRFLMLDRTLQVSPVTATATGPTGVRLISEDADARDVPFAEIIALVPDWWRPGNEGIDLAWTPAPSPSRRDPTQGAGMLLLTDGRRLLGRLAPDVKADEIAWD